MLQRSCCFAKVVRVPLNLDKSKESMPKVYPLLSGSFSYIYIFIYLLFGQILFLLSLMFEIKLGRVNGR